MADNWNIRPYQIEILDIFRVFEGICKKHNLRYYADGGTALGAVRHKGFIPWDDDLDVNMPREDYNKFVKIVADELPKHLSFRRGGEAVDAPIDFSKIVNVNPEIVKRMREQTGLEGIVAPFIDIFVLEGVPEKLEELGRWWRKRRMLRLCQLYRYPDSAIASGGAWRFKILLARMVGFFVSWFFQRTSTNEEMMRLMDNQAMDYPFDSAQTVVEPAFYRGKTSRLMPRFWFDPARELPFEGGTIRVPAHVDQFLERTFGDYMKLPPPEHRIPEHAFKRAYNHV